MNAADNVHAAMLQLIAEGIRSPSTGRLSQDQLERVAGLLDHIAVELLVPTPEPNEDQALSRLSFGNAARQRLQAPHRSFGVVEAVERPELSRGVGQL